jgi:2-oxo-4-hydroxy-4-carboxy-5-ureidoimidazoline decarboxylase
MIQRINSWTPEIARQKFLQCCGSRRWADEMTAARPFASWEALEETASATWKGSTRDDILEAFSAHAKIGDHRGNDEQAGVRGASETTLEVLAQLNREYEARFGFIYIVCASGKSAEEMLALLRRRLPNDPEQEIAIAAEEQRLITQLRLRQL